MIKGFEDRFEDRLQKNRANSNVILKYLSSLRSEKTREGARKIIEFLDQKRVEQWDNRDSDNKWHRGWTRSGEIFSEMRRTIDNPNTITRLLRSLTEQSIIERRECSRIKGKSGNPPVFYRMPDTYEQEIFFSREDLLQELHRCREENLKITQEKEALYNVLFNISEKKRKELTPLIDVEIKKIQDEFEAWTNYLNTEMKKSGFGKLNPCDFI